jgi:Pyruvate/2-oxoacid:ferredoxin oxidoreductase delta subunit/type III secretory pathway component EscS
MTTQTYSEVIIYYFSGTGNARHTALWIKDEANEAGIEVRLFNIAEMSRHEVPAPPEKSLIGFISPTHGFHFPGIMRRFIKEFPKSRNCCAFIMNTRGGLRISKAVIGGISGVLHYWSALILRKKRFKMLGLFPVDLPSNWISLHPAIGKKGTLVIYKHIEPKVREFAKTILKGNRNYKALSLRNMILDVIISPVSIGYMLVGKYLFSKTYIATSACNNCGICDKTCPVQAIKEVDGRKFWTFTCESCMQCMNSCPQKAIETAHGFIVLIWFATSLVVRFLVGQLLKSPLLQDWYWLQNEGVVFGLKSILILPILFFGYRMMHFLMRYKLFEHLFVWTSLTKLKFWGRYKAP